MNPEKWEGGIGHRINQMANKMSPVSFESIVLSSERNNSESGFQSLLFGDTVRVQSGAGDDKPGVKVSAVCTESVDFILGFKPLDLGIEQHDSPAFLDKVCQGGRHAFKIHDAGAWNFERGSTIDVGFPVTRLKRRNFSSLDVVGDGPG